VTVCIAADELRAERAELMALLNRDLRSTPSPERDSEISVLRALIADLERELALH